MKIRKYFVSNSSSSSFIVIGTGNNKINKNLLDKFFTDSILIVDDNFGETQFGWQNEKYSDIGSRINFAYIQAKYVEKQHPDWLKMLEKVIKNNTNVKEIRWELRFDYVRGGKNYSVIDHQSASYEDENIGMYENEEELTNFIFDESSYIQCGNDNE